MTILLSLCMMLFSMYCFSRVNDIYVEIYQKSERPWLSVKYPQYICFTELAIMAKCSCCGTRNKFTKRITTKQANSLLCVDNMYRIHICGKCHEIFTILFMTGDDIDKKYFARITKPIEIKSLTKELFISRIPDVYNIGSCTKQYIIELYKFSNGGK